MIFYISQKLPVYRDPDIYYISDPYLPIRYFKNTTLPIGSDTETLGFDPYTKELLSLQLGDETHQYVIDLTTIDIRLYKELLESKTLIFHNSKFDLRFLYHWDIFPTSIRDTYLQEVILTTGFKDKRRSLEAVVQKYLKITLNKSIRGLIHKEGFTPRVIKYAAEDVKYLVPLNTHQTHILDIEQLNRTADLENKFAPVLAYTEYCGLYLNRERWLQKCDTDKKALQVSEKALNNWLIKNYPSYINPQLSLFDTDVKVLINWSSAQQVIELFNKLGIDTKTIDKETGELKDSVESKVLKSQENKFPIIPLYLEYKKQDKVVSTYGIKWVERINPKSRRLHTSYTQIMNTGRLSSGGKDKDNDVEFFNLQNIPRETNTRGCFTNSSEDTVLITADFSGQEQIVLANMSMESNLLHFYDSGLEDMHSFIASKLFEDLKDKPASEIKKFHSDKRYIAKIAGFSINYGGVGATIANNLSMPLEVGENVYNEYFKAFPGLNDFFKKSQNEAKEQGYIVFNDITKQKSYIPFFRRYKELETVINKKGFWDVYKYKKENDSANFEKYWKPLVRQYMYYKGQIERKSVNYKIQGTSANITKLAGILFLRALREADLLKKVYICNLIHDEILVESPKSIAEQIAKLLQDSMENAGIRFFQRVKLKATPVISTVWEH